MTARDRAVARFHEAFACSPDALVRSPGRVNLIGEHTDYNDGWVLPMAIEPALWMAVGWPQRGRRLEMVSDDVDGWVDVDLDDIGGRLDGWAAYCQGVAWALQEAGRHVTGVRGVVASDIPTGAGLSSSAALELAVARALVGVGGDWEPSSVAAIAQRAENEWVGVQTGIMDQLASGGGRADHALLIDCRDVSVTPVALSTDVCVLVMDTGSRRELVGSAYDERRAQCEQAAQQLGVPTLREVDAAAVDSLDEPLLRRRARHVVTENDRVLAMVEALRSGAVVRAGELMDESHASLRDDFEVSSPELDTMVNEVRRQAGCLGARMTGAGFGGCAVALVEDSRVDDVAAATQRAYDAATGHSSHLMTTQATDGTGWVDTGS